MKHRRGIIIAALAALAVATILLWRREPEPRYAGKKISHWINELRVSSGTPDEMVKPFLAMGSNAAPWLIREFSKKDSRVWLGFVALCEKLPPEIFDFVMRPTPTPSLRQTAVLVLARIGPGAVPALARGLGDSQHDTRLFSCLTLGKIHPLPPEAIRALTECLRDTDDEIRLSAAAALGKNIADDPAIATSLARALLEPKQSRRVREKLAQVLATSGAPALRDLMNTFQSPDARVRLAIVSAFEKVELSSSNRAPALLLALHDARPRVRAKAAELLGKYDRTHPKPASTEVANALLDAAHDPEASVRRAAANSLMYSGVAAESMIPLMVQRLKENSPEDRAQAANWLGYYRSIGDSAVVALVSALHDDAIGVRYAAAMTLSQVAPDRCEAAFVLIDCLHSDDPWIRMNEFLPVGKFHACAETLVPALRSLATNETTRAQLCAIQALGELGAAARPALPELIRALKSGHPDVRMQAMSALANFGSDARAALPDLFVSLTSGLDVERSTASRVLGLIGAGDAETIELLIETASSPRDEFRLPAVQSLGWLGAGNEKVHTVLSRAANDASPWVRLTAVQALIDAKMPLQECVPLLQSLLRTFNPPVASTNQPALLLPSDLAGNYEAKKRICQAIIALGPTAQPLVPALAELLESRSPFAAELSALTLGELKLVATDAVPALAKMLASPNAHPRFCAAVALQNILPDAAAQFPDLPNLLRELNSAQNFFMFPDPRDWLARESVFHADPGQLMFLGTRPAQP